jgi:hypothetical protein
MVLSFQFQDTHPSLSNVNAIVPIQLPACGSTARRRGRWQSAGDLFRTERAIDLGPQENSHPHFENSSYRKQRAYRRVEAGPAPKALSGRLPRDRVVSLYWFAYRPSMAVPLALETHGYQAALTDIGHRDIDRFPAIATHDPQLYVVPDADLF